MPARLRLDSDMSEHPTVLEALEEVRRYRRGRRCPDCKEIVSIRGIGGNHWWMCPSCDAVGLGYPTRAAVRDDLLGESS